jgi:hypothetical protein
LQIEREITDDALDGQPWPPGLGEHWWLVKRLPSHRTVWRRIFLGGGG